MSFLVLFVLTVRFYSFHKVEIISAALVVGVFGKYYNCPVITYGESTGAVLIDVTRLPTTIVMSANSKRCRTPFHIEIQEITVSELP